MGFLVRCSLEVKAKSNNCCNVEIISVKSITPSPTFTRAIQGSIAISICFYRMKVT